MNHKAISYTRDEVMAMLAAGKSMRQLAKDLGCSRTTVYWLVHPEKYDEQKERNREYTRKSRANKAAVRNNAAPIKRERKRRKPSGLIRYAGWEPGGASW